VDIRAGIANARSGMVYRTRKPDPRPRAASSRPAAGRRTLLGALALLGMFGPALADPAPNDFDPFIAGLWPAAQAQGVSRKTFDAAAKGLHFDPKIAAHTQHQAEFLVPVWTYLAGAVIPARIVVGRKQYAALHDVLARAQRVYGVDPGPIMGAWGVETEFGAFSGGQNVLDALATLGFMRYQGDFGRDELLAAMRIVEAGDTPPGGMRGSWAGAMGQPQFLPSSFLKYAVDFDGDGKRDIWDDRSDVLASIANYLQRSGWRIGEPWGVAVTVPPGLNDSGHASLTAWSQRGVRLADGGALRGDISAHLLVPGGEGGDAFLAYPNFAAIRRYNPSDFYALAVGMLGDRVVG
jgi:membrane-bound lytic murein transglycosylase B